MGSGMGGMLFVFTWRYMYESCLGTISQNNGVYLFVCLFWVCWLVAFLLFCFFNLSLLTLLNYCDSFFYKSLPTLLSQHRLNEVKSADKP